MSKTTPKIPKEHVHVQAVQCVNSYTNGTTSAAFQPQRAAYRRRTGGAYRLTGGAYRLTGGAYRLAGGAYRLAGGACRLTGGAYRLAGGACRLMQATPDVLPRLPSGPGVFPPTDR